MATQEAITSATTPQAQMSIKYDGNATISGRCSDFLSVYCFTLAFLLILYCNTHSVAIC